MGKAVDSIPTQTPEMMLVAGPVCEASASTLPAGTGIPYRLGDEHEEDRHHNADDAQMKKFEVILRPQQPARSNVEPTIASAS